MWKNTVEQGRTRVATWRMRISCWITKATNSHSEYVIPRFNAFPLQEWLHERASSLRVFFSNLGPSRDVSLKNNRRSNFPKILLL